MRAGGAGIWGALQVTIDLPGRLPTARDTHHRPQFHYQGRQRDVNVFGDDISSLETEIGTQVTATVD